MKRYVNDISEIPAGRLVRFVLIFALIGLSGLTSPGGSPRSAAFWGPKLSESSQTPPAAAPADSTRADIPADGQPPRFIVGGWLPFWEADEGMRVIREFPAALDDISPFWYKVAEDGHVVISSGAGEMWFLETLRSMGKRVFPTISGFDGTQMSSLFNDDQKRAFHIERILDLVISRNYDGIDIDYESLRPEDRDAYSRFVRELSAALHGRDKKLVITVHAKTQFPGSPATSYAHDYAAIGQTADYVRIMAYDEHYSGGPSGPVASLPWVEKVVAHAVTNIPREKIILGVPAYGYDWPAGGGRGRAVTYEDVVGLAASQGTAIQWDEGSASPVVRYTDGSGRHTVWFENARSLTAKVDLARRYRLGGIVIWRLGREDKAIYNLLSEL